MTQDKAPSKQKRLRLERLRHSVERLQEYIDRDNDALTPDLIVAKSVISLWASAWAYCGDDLGREWAEWIDSKMRTYSGICQHCENSVAPGKTHPPICEHCDARLDAQVREIEEELNGSDQN